jgi:hypothetical protein
MRLNFSGSLPTHADVKDVSVYGTTDDFRGHADPGKSLVVDAAWKCSVTRPWVLALDGIYQHSRNTKVIGVQNGKNVRLDGDSSWSYGFSRAFEYNISPTHCRCPRHCAWTKCLFHCGARDGHQYRPLINSTAGIQLAAVWESNTSGLTNATMAVVCALARYARSSCGCGRFLRTKVALEQTG